MQPDAGRGGQLQSPTMQSIIPSCNDNIHPIHTTESLVQLVAFLLRLVEELDELEVAPRSGFQLNSITSTNAPGTKLLTPYLNSLAECVSL